MSHNHKNFAYSTLTNAPGSAGTTFNLQAGDGAKFPELPFNATVWPAGVQPTSTNAEIVVVTAYNGDDAITVTRAQEGTSAINISTTGYQFAATITAKTLTDAEGLLPFWSPFILGSGAASGLQTLASATNVSSTASMLVFPVTIPSDMIFNQVVLLNSISFLSSAATGSNTYYSRYGFYSMNANTLSLISSSHFSIKESISGATYTWILPTTTATSGYGYGNLSSGASSYLTATTMLNAYIGSIRSIGLQFGSDISISGGVYWLGLLSLRSTGNASTFGLSHAGIVGQPINALNQAGTVNGLNPIGIGASQWSTYNSHLTGWWGRHIAGFITATTLANFGGTAIPTSFDLSALGGIAAASTVTILPTVTFVST